MSVVALVSGALEFQLLQSLQGGAYASQAAAMEAANANDTRQQLIAWLELGLLIACAVAVLRWIYRANANARALGAKELKFTPGWAVGWYFVPILFLWKPYQAMKEIWKASSDPSDWSNRKVSSLLPWWWFFWVSSCILGQLSFRLALSAKEIHQLIAANAVTNLASFVEIPTALILLSIVRSVTLMQVTARRASAEAPVSTPRIPGLAGAPFATRIWR